MMSKSWIPAFAGMTKKPIDAREPDPGLRHKNQTESLAPRLTELQIALIVAMSAGLTR